MNLANIYIPDNISKIISGKTYKTNKVGLSNSIILCYDEVILKIMNDSCDYNQSVNILSWLDGKIPTPQLIEHAADEKHFYLLMSRVKGDMACSPKFMECPKKLVGVLADALQLLWSIDIFDCPNNQNIDVAIKRLDKEGRFEQSMDRIIDLLKDVPIENKERDLIRELLNDKKSIFQRLSSIQSNYSQVLSHGDFCLPNVMLSDWVLNGFVDVGGMGISDCWRDIALCYRSLVRNFNGYYGGHINQNFQASWLFDALGINPDWERMSYWLILDEM